MSGRMFDMGHLKNEAIAKEGDRAKELYRSNRIGHPFAPSGSPLDSVYAIFHRWEGGSAMYSVSPHPVTNNELRMTIAEATAFVDLDMKPMWLVATEMTIAMFADRPNMLKVYAVDSAMPSKTDDQLNNVCNTTLQPILASMLLLATDGVETQEEIANERVNKRRIHERKTPYPNYFRVNTGPYITALTMTREQKRALYQGGHHASPIPHLRRAHIRHKHIMHGGGEVWVRDSVINLRDPNAPLQRSFYSTQRGIK